MRRAGRRRQPRHFSRILAARALGLASENRRLFASITASIPVIEDYHGERCIRRWNVDAALLDGIGDRTASGENVAPTEALREDRLWPSTRPWISVIAAAACVGALGALVAKSSLQSCIVLAAMVALAFGIEAIFRRVSGTPFRAHQNRT